MISEHDVMTSNLEDINSYIKNVYLTNNSLVITVPRAWHGLSYLFIYLFIFWNFILFLNFT